MAVPAVALATYADLLALPEHQVGELLDGELFVQGRPATPHGEAASVLAMDLGSAFHRGRGGPGGWILLFEPELHLGGDVLVPDLAGWRRARVPALPKAAAVTVAPDWVCEVLSPSTARKDRGRKMPIYGREGVSHVWLVDPDARYVEVFRLAPGGYVQVAVAGDAEPAARLEPFAEVALDLGALWPAAPEGSGEPGEAGSGE